MKTKPTYHFKDYLYPAVFAFAGLFIPEQWWWKVVFGGIGLIWLFVQFAMDSAVEMPDDYESTI